MAASSAAERPRGREPAIGWVSGQPQQVQVRAGVAAPQQPVDVERVCVGGQVEALAGHDLKGLAGLDLFDRGRHRRHVLLGCLLPDDGRRGHRFVRDRDQGFGRFGQPGRHRQHPVAGVAPGLLGPLG
jgi:hypothetical protein